MIPAVVIAVTVAVVVAFVAVVCSLFLIPQDLLLSLHLQLRLFSLSSLINKGVILSEVTRTRVAQSKDLRLPLSFLPTPRPRNQRAESTPQTFTRIISPSSSTFIFFSIPSLFASAINRSTGSCIGSRPSLNVP
jgi:hypothetical protein